MMQGKVSVGINFETLPTKTEGYQLITEVHYSSEAIFFPYGLHLYS